MESISSMKMMAGAFFSASSNAFLRLLSDSPASFDMISGPLMRKKKAPGRQQALLSEVQATVLKKAWLRQHSNTQHEATLERQPLSTANRLLVCIMCEC
jgi:hypothetical protein